MRRVYPPYHFHHAPARPVGWKRFAAAVRRAGRVTGRLTVVSIVLLSVQAVLLQAFYVPTGSMADTVKPYDQVIAEKITYFFREPVPGEIVILRDPDDPHGRLIKRVIAVGGQSVDFIGGSVYVDGVPLSETYARAETSDTGLASLPLIVPKGHVFLMGDNRTNSRDARQFGPQPLRAIEARALLTFWPPNDAGLLVGQKPVPMRSAGRDTRGPRDMMGAWSRL